MAETERENTGTKERERRSVTRGGDRMGGGVGGLVLGTLEV